MRQLFIRTMSAVCGALVILAPMSAAAEQAHENIARYYFLSLSGLTRLIAHTGKMTFLTMDGEKILYTDFNITGRKPAADAELVRVVYGKAPTEIHPIVDKDTYIHSRRRAGANSVQPNVVIYDVSRPADGQNPPDPSGKLGLS